MTLLTALNGAQRLLSLTVSSSIVSDNQETQNLLFELAKYEVEDCARRHEWPELRRTHTFTASLASLQSAPGKPTDFDRIVKDTFWNRTTDKRVTGPMTDQEWAIAYGEPFTSAIAQYWMLRYDGLHIFPVPTAADTMAFDYIINTPWQSNAGTALTTPTADNDVSKFGDRLLTLGVTWRYKQAKGRDYAEDLRNYEMRLASQISASRSARTVSIGPRDYDPIPIPLIPETGYGS